MVTIKFLIIDLKLTNCLIGVNFRVVDAAEPYPPELACILSNL